MKIVSVAMLICFGYVSLSIADKTTNHEFPRYLYKGDSSCLWSCRHILNECLTSCHEQCKKDEDRVCYPKCISPCQKQFQACDSHCKTMVKDKNDYKNNR